MAAAPLKATLAQAANLDKLGDVLWQNKDTVSSLLAKPGAPVGVAADDVRRFLNAPAQPRRFSFARPLISDLIQKLRQTGMPFAARLDAVTKFLSDHAVPETMSGWPHASPADGDPAVETAHALLEAKALLGRLVPTEQGADVLEKDPSWIAFETDLATDTRRRTTMSSSIVRRDRRQGKMRFTTRFEATRWPEY